MKRDPRTAEVPFAVIHDEESGNWIRFSQPARIVEAVGLGDVLPRLREVERAVEVEHLHAAGWISYEAAAGFDAALTSRPPGELPLLWFGLFEKADPMVLPQAGMALPDGWQADTSAKAYQRAFDCIKAHIRAGDTYQVNYTYRLRQEAFEADAWQVFLTLAGAQRAACGAYLSAGRWRICSASPELFFRVDGNEVESRPMKGTAPRGLWSEQDRIQAEALLASEKNRAENLMIVDMVRHDLGRVARPGTIRAGPLCKLEKYPTVWQLTSTVRAETDAPVSDLFTAMFPPSSITGAPKKRTMEIIAELESSPRQVYTGAIGFLAPGRRAQFSVGIRTLWVDTLRRRAEYGVGGGIVWDSDREAELAECRTKARILSAPPRPAFALLETMLWTPDEGIRLLARHLARLGASADYFNYIFDETRVRGELNKLADALPKEPQRIRLLLAEDGSPTFEVHPVPSRAKDRPFRLALARRPVDRADAFLYHKTTNRRVYEEAKADFPTHDDVMLWNDREEVTEATIANLVFEVDGVRYTPPVECGLLPGVARAEELACGRLIERVISLDDLRRGPRLFILNSVRGLLPAVLDESAR